MGGRLVSLLRCELESPQRSATEIEQSLSRSYAATLA
jgi:hypothetical protein